MHLLDQLRDRLVAGDPGLTRLLMALRATAGVGLSLTILLWIAHVYRLPLTVPLLGAAIGMTWSLGVTDRAPAEQRATTLLLWFPAAGALTLGTATAANRILADVIFLAVLFTAVYIRKFGPRGYASGMVGVITFFFALFLRATFAQLPWLLAALAVTAVCTYVLRFFVLPDRPSRALGNAVDAFEARRRLIAGTIAAAKRRGGWSARSRMQLQHHIFRLNESALAIDDILRDIDAPEERAAVIDAELRTEEAAQQALQDPHSTPALQPLRLSVERVRAAGWTPRGAFRVGTQLDTGVLTPSLRQAIQLTAAGAASIVAGELLSPQRWYWAVLAAFVIFSGTSSSGETLKKAWSRFLGTALGVAAGIVVGTLVHGDKTLAFILLFVCLFAAVYFIRISYAVMIFFITALLSLLYVLLGLFSDSLLMLRLIETGIGAAFGGLAARFLLPIRTRDVLESVAVEALQRLKDVVRLSVQKLTGDDASADPLTAARTYDEAVQSVRTQLEPLIRLRRAGTEQLERRLLLFAACGYYARALARSASNGKPDRAGAITALERIERAVHRLGESLAPRS